MQSFRVLLFLALLVVAVPCARPADDQVALTERFVRTLKFAEQSALGFGLATDRARTEGKINDDQLACIRQVSAEEFVPVMIELANLKFSAAEMQEAIEFFETSAGQKYLQMSEAKTAEMVGAKSTAVMPEFTSKETRAINRFGTTPLYQKLVKQAVMTRSPEAQSRLNGKLWEFVRRCARS